MEAKPLRRILYVDDEPDIREIARLALEAVGGFEVTVCSSGREAVEMVPRVAPDLILLDVMMPEMDGCATLTALKERADTRDIPVIFMTAKVQARELARYLELGALDVIGKPFDPMTLPDTVNEIWKRSRGEI